MNSIARHPVRVIVNPHAGRGRGRRSAERIRRVLEAASIPFALELSERKGHASTLASQARRAGFRALLAVGGDGTVDEVVNGLADATPPAERLGPLIVLPSGSGNDFAANTGSPRREDELPRVIEQPIVRRLDLGRARFRTREGESMRFFDNTLGVGLEAQVNREALRIRYLRGALLYAVAALRALRRLEAPVIELSWEAEDGSLGNAHGSFMMITAGNGARSGGGFYLTPGARLDDGLLDLAYVEALPRSRIALLLPRALRGGHTDHPAVHIVRCRRFALTSSSTLPVHVDGELLDESFNSIAVELEPARLELFT